MKVLKLCLLVQIIFFKVTYAQSELPKIIPPSPNAAAFHKYGEYPVSHYTGVPDISIPIYDVQSLKLNCPISIRFHASGFKPNELDGILGLNWSLSAGGMVSRQIIGIPDDMATGMLYNNPRHDLASVSSLFPRYGFEYLESVNQKAVDSEYDIFSYSVNGISGSFILKRNGTILDYTIDPVMISNKKKEKIKVRLNSGGLIESFDVVDENGITYRFGKSLSGTSATEAISSETSGPYSGFNTSWLLTDIVSSDKTDTISFLYSAHRVRQTSNDVFSSGVNYLNFAHYVGMPGDPGFYSPLPATTYSGSASNSSIFYKVRDLEEIRFSNGKVLFTYVPNNDSPQQNYLSTVKVYDDNNQQIKGYNFYVSPYTSTRSYRRKLDSMTIDGIETYNFEYNNDSITPYNPLSADWWGYFNGSYFPGAMSPTITLPSSMSIGDGVNRDANSNMVNYMIKKIIYPTGGSSEFLFEPNYVKNGGSLSTIGGTRIRKVTNDDGLGNKTYKEYKYGANEDGAGIATSPYVVDNVLTSNFIYSNYLHGSSNFWQTYERISISPYLNSLINYSSPIYYSEIAEYDTDNLSSNLGKIIYKYQSIPGSLIQKTDGNIGCFSYFLPPVSGLPTKQTMSPRQSRIISPDRYGLLEKKEVYEKYLSAYRLLEEEIMTYDIETFPEIKSLIVEAKNQYLHNGMDDRVNLFSQTSYSNGPSVLANVPRSLYAPFLYENCYIQPSTVNLKSRTVKKYFNGQMVENGQQYSYDNPLHGFPTSSLKWNKNYNALEVGKMTEIIYKRALEKSTITSLTPEQGLAIDSMVRKNMIATVIEEDQNFTTREEVVGGYRTDGNKRKRINYKIWSSNGHIIAPKDIQISTSNLPLETVTEFHAYDAKGNPLSVSKKDGPRLVYVWGYNHKYPIAEISNADYLTVRSLLGGDPAINTFNAILYPTDYQINSYLSALRGSLSGAMVKTYAYYPLVGIKATTDAKGMNTYYEYDNFQRLLNIKDHNGDILKNYKYNYK